MNPDLSNTGLQFYVSLDGSDASDGSAPFHEEGTNIGPWKTLSHALSQIRKQRSNNPGPENEATINILAGTHYQSSKLKLDPRDSYLTIQAFNDDPVSISGGQPLISDEWTEQNQIKTATFPFNSCGEIFMGKDRLLPARSPNTDWGFNRNVARGQAHHIKVNVK